MGILAWVSGGLEIPIALHLANNLVAFVLIWFVTTDSGSTDVSLLTAFSGSALSIAATIIVITRPNLVGVRCWRTTGKGTAGLQGS